MICSELLEKELVEASSKKTPSGMSVEKLDLFLRVLWVFAMKN